MTMTFSKKFKNMIDQNKIRISIPRGVRNRFKYLCEDYNFYYDYNFNNYQKNYKDFIEKILDILKKEHGLIKLEFFEPTSENEKSENEFHNFIIYGKFPHHVLDFIELFYFNLDDNKKNQFQKEFNEICKESNFRYRLIDGEIYLIDSIYIEEEIINKSIVLLKNQNFIGPLKEFLKAREDFINEDYKNSIANSSKALESTMKSILKIDNARPGELIRKIIDSKIIPDYFNDFLNSFKNILKIVLDIRNNEKGAGHGQGNKVFIVPKEIAELSLHLCASLIYYLINRFITIDKDS